MKPRFGQCKARQTIFRKWLDICSPSRRMTYTQRCCINCNRIHNLSGIDLEEVYVLLVQGAVNCGRAVDLGKIATHFDILEEGHCDVTSILCLKWKDWLGKT